MFFDNVFLSYQNVFRASVSRYIIVYIDNVLFV